MVTQPTQQTSQSACSVCPANQNSKLVRLGVEMKEHDFLVALAGNPNTGKSTVFNSLTGLRQHTGNWPGKTVARAEGGFQYNEKKFKLVDLPGTYSLLSSSVDEEIARDFILFGRPDVTVVVVDSTRLERNLNLVLQVFEITDKVVLCLNLMDEARRHRIHVDVRRLSKDLGVPVIPTAARQYEGVPQLLNAIHEVAEGDYVCKPHHIKEQKPAVKKAIEELVPEIEQAYPGLPNARWVALRLLEGDTRIMEAIKTGELGDLSKGDPVHLD
jgi:ferrous iron transport protein B